MRKVKLTAFDWFKEVSGNVNSIPLKFSEFKAALKQIDPAIDAEVKGGKLVVTVPKIKHANTGNEIIDLQLTLQPTKYGYILINARASKKSSSTHVLEEGIVCLGGIGAGARGNPIELVREVVEGLAYESHRVNKKETYTDEILRAFLDS